MVVIVVRMVAQTLIECSWGVLVCLVETLGERGCTVSVGHSTARRVGVRSWMVVVVCLWVNGGGMVMVVETLGECGCICCAFHRKMREGYSMSSGKISDKNFRHLG